MMLLDDMFLPEPMIKASRAFDQLRVDLAFSSAIEKISRKKSTISEAAERVGTKDKPGFKLLMDMRKDDEKRKKKKKKKNRRSRRSRR